METVQKSIRIPRQTAEAIEKIVQESGRDFSSITKDLLEESIKMRRCPGIVFTEGVKGKRAKIAGTGIEVWEVIATLKSVDGDFKRLEKAYHWLTNQQLRSALGYYHAFRAEIENLIDRNRQWRPEKLLAQHPFLNVGLS